MPDDTQEMEPVVPDYGHLVPAEDWEKIVADAEVFAEEEEK